MFWSNLLEDLKQLDAVLKVKVVERVMVRGLLREKVDILACKQASKVR